MPVLSLINLEKKREKKERKKVGIFGVETGVLVEIKNYAKKREKINLTTTRHVHTQTHLVYFACACKASYAKKCVCGGKRDFRYTINRDNQYSFFRRVITKERLSYVLPHYYHYYYYSYHYYYYYFIVSIRVLQKERCGDSHPAQEGAM